MGVGAVVGGRVGATAADSTGLSESGLQDVYTAPSLSSIPFWVVAGNHDHLGNVTTQIEYTSEFVL